MHRKRKHNDRPENKTYEILVEGQLGEAWSPWFEDLKIKLGSNPENGSAITILSGHITDQAALHGILNKIRDLNLKLISVRTTGYQPSHRDHQPKEKLK